MNGGYACPVQTVGALHEAPALRPHRRGGACPSRKPSLTVNHRVSSGVTMGASMVEKAVIDTESAVSVQELGEQNEELTNELSGALGNLISFVFTALAVEA